jgi:uncharacterized protein
MHGAMRNKRVAELSLGQSDSRQNADRVWPLELCRAAQRDAHCPGVLVPPARVTSCLSWVGGAESFWHQGWRNRLAGRKSQAPETTMVQWKDQRQSSNIEDRRGEEGDRADMSGGIRIPMGRSGGGMGILGMIIVVGLMWLFGGNLSDILGTVLNGGGGGAFPMPRVDQGGNALPKLDIPGLPGSKKIVLPGGSGGQIGPSDDGKAFVGNVLGSTEEIWTQIFQGFGKSYTNPKLVMFSGQTSTACGPGLSAMGPFYCPLDQQVYLDTSFFDDLKRRFGAPGDFAQAYVIAHEVGHHVQKELGIADQVQNLKQRVSEKDANALQVRMELQADCLAGVWAAQAVANGKMVLEQGDVEEALNAANQIGDDRLQKASTGRVVPDAFTHGSSEQRVRWFKAGITSANIQSCDTFNAEQL